MLGRGCLFDREAAGFFEHGQRQLGQRQRAVLHAQPVEHTHRRQRQIVAMAQEAAGAHGQGGDQLFPLIAAKLRAIERGGAQRRGRAAEPADQFGIAEPPAGLAHDPRAHRQRNLFAQRDQPQISGGLQPGIARLRPLAQQVDQLPELRARSRFAGGAVAQHSGKAVVEMHAISGRDTRSVARVIAYGPSYL